MLIRKKYLPYLHHQYELKGQISECNHWGRCLVIGRDTFCHSIYIRRVSFTELVQTGLTTGFWGKKGIASTPTIEYQVFLFIFQKNSAMATLGLKEMGKFLWEGKKKVFPVGCLSLVLFENAKKNLVFHFGGGRHASFPQKPVVNKKRLGLNSGLKRVQM